MTPKVCIIILNYNGRQYLGRLLDKAIESALNQTHSNVEVFFVDNGSVDDSVEYVKRKYGTKVKVIALEKNYGFCLGNNLASKHVSPDAKYILFMNPDVVLSSNYVEKLLSIMETNNSVGIAQGLQVSSDGSIHSIGGFVDTYGRSIEIDIRMLMPLYSNKGPLTVLWASGSAMMIKSELFDKLGGFSPELFMYHDEIDLCSRALFLGYRTVCIPEVMYYHKRGIVETPNRINWFSWYFSNRNRWLTTIRYFPTRLLILIVISLPMEFLIHVYKSIHEKERQRIRLYIHIIKYLFKHFKREISIRKKYSKYHKLLLNYIISTPLLRVRV